MSATRLADGPNRPEIQGLKLRRAEDRRRTGGVGTIRRMGRCADAAPGATQFTLFKERWLAVRDGKVLDLSFAELAERVAADIAQAFVPPDL